MTLVDPLHKIWKPWIEYICMHIGQIKYNPRSKLPASLINRQDKKINKQNPSKILIETKCLLIIY